MGMRTAWVAGLLVASGVCLGEVRADERPNIIFIFSDDHSFYDAGAYGNDEVATPNLDRLAEQGATFTHAYNMGSYSPAVCIASRTMLLSGKSLWEADRHDRQEFREAGQYWPQLLSEAGYRTYMTGKWHVPNVPVNEVFDVVRNERPGMPNQTDAGYQRPGLPSADDPWSPYDIRFEGFWQGGKHWSEVLVDDTEAMLEDAQSHDAPFFMYLCFNAPHDPRQSPREFVQMYPQQDVRIPENYLPEYPYNEAIGSGRDLRDERLAPFPRTPFATRVQRQEYYAIITHMDHQIGRILRAVEAADLEGETWIIYSSDHGLAVGQHGLMGKQNMYDHSLRVPFIVTGPGVEAGQRVEEPIYLQDVMPTVLELAGADVPDAVQYHSVLPLLDGEASPYDAIYGAYLEDRQRAIVADGYKLILYPRAERVRLFNLADDPYEMHDLSDDEDQAPRIRRLMSRLVELQQEMGDELDLEQAFPQWF